jgi:acyl-CoA thioesterase-1
MYIVYAILLLFTTLVANATTPENAARTLLVFGDSLSTGYGLAPEQGWVSLLGKRLAAREPPWRVVNASVSGETTAGGASRIAAALHEHQPSLVVLALGANDGLRGLPLDQAQANLQRILNATAAARAEVLLIGMRIPPNYGPDDSAQFDALFANVATQNGVATLPFLLEPIAADDSAFQADNLHPVAAVQTKLMEHVWTTLAPIIDRAEELP